MRLPQWFSAQSFQGNSVRRRRPSNQIGLQVVGLEPRALLSTVVAHVQRRPVIQMATNHSGQNANVTPRRWQWLANTYWYVPKANLPAIIYNSGNGDVIPIQDQTVYHISGYREGYFWGETVAQYGATAPSSSSVIGSVTPQGKLLLSFNSGSTIIQGIGTMTRKNGGWTMENQMFTGSTSVQIGHWAYMVQTRPGMKSWNNLPFVNQSVPTFLSNYNLPKPTPVVS